MKKTLCLLLAALLVLSLAACGKLIPWQVEIISIDGQIKE